MYEEELFDIKAFLRRIDFALGNFTHGKNI